MYEYECIFNHLLDIILVTSHTKSMYISVSVFVKSATHVPVRTAPTPASVAEVAARTPLQDKSNTSNSPQTVKSETGAGTGAEAFGAEVEIYLLEIDSGNTNIRHNSHLTHTHPPPPPPQLAESMPAAPPAPAPAGGVDGEGLAAPKMQGSYDYGSSVLPPVSRSFFGSPGGGDTNTTPSLFSSRVNSPSSTAAIAAQLSQQPSKQDDINEILALYGNRRQQQQPSIGMRSSYTDISLAAHAPSPSRALPMNHSSIYASSNGMRGSYNHDPKRSTAPNLCVPTDLRSR